MSGLSRAQVTAWSAADAASTARAALVRQSDGIDTATRRALSRGTVLGTSGDWLGRGYDGAMTAMGDAHSANVRTADVLWRGSDIVYNGLTEMHYASRALLQMADSAEADGCIVGDDWSVHAAGSEDEPEAKVALWQPQINRQLFQLENADRSASAEIQTVIFPLLAGAAAALGISIAAAEIAATAFVALALAAGTLAAIAWVAEHFPDVDLGEIFSRSSIDLSDGGPGEWVAKERNHSASSGAYEQQVTGAPPGAEYVVPADGTPAREVAFDGFEGGATPDKSDDVLVEGKGPGYAPHFTKDGEWQPWSRVRDDVDDQLTRQYAAAQQHDAQVEWRVAEPQMAEGVQREIDRLGFGGRIRVKVVPPEGG